MTDPSLLDPPATVVDRRGETHLARETCGPWPHVGRDEAAWIDVLAWEETEGGRL